MTKEQAIEKAKEQYNEIWDCDINHPKYEDTVEEIVTGVIRLIMQPSEDCVSRQAVIEHLVANLTWYDNDNEESDIREVITELVNEIPPVIPTHGTCKDCIHWDKDDEYCKHLSSEHGWLEDDDYRVYAEEDFYCKEFTYKE